MELLSEVESKFNGLDQTEFELIKLAMILSIADQQSFFWLCQ